MLQPEKNYIIVNKALQNRFAKKFNVSNKDVQEFFYEMVSLLSKDSTITAKLLVEFAKNSDKYAHYLFDWQQSSKEIEERAEEILNQITILIDRDGNIYNLTGK